MTHTNCSCPLCVPDKPIGSVSTSATNSIPLVIDPSIPITIPTGWLCSLCNTVYAPSVTECSKHVVTLQLNADGCSVIVTNDPELKKIDPPTDE